ncbi:unnamed protein product [Clonostachys rhizophaga]|uniref:Uncharacterized protein n=1 Tax=Clonostachys rhizophaga TaxID=160324 RepID=A0A9N9YLB9_9HYPO|nr:unnamed protein product [Clonostachys rhizophaga]
MRSTLFHRSGYAYMDFLRLISYIFSFIGLGLILPVYYREQNILVFEMTVVVCKCLITLGPVVVEYYSPTYAQTLHYRAVAILALSWCLLITVVFGILNDIVTCFVGQFRPIDSANGFVAPREIKWLYTFGYWLNVIAVLGHAIQDV